MRELLGLEQDGFEGKPLICVPIIGRTQESIYEQAQVAVESKADVIEWRADFFDDDLTPETLTAVLEKLREIIKDKPLLFTFRTAEEGGDKAVSLSDYEHLYHTVMETELADILDIQLMTVEDRSTLIQSAHEKEYLVLVSYHNFEETPEADDLLGIFARMKESQGDIFKIAVMPNDNFDVLRVLTVSEQAQAIYFQPLVCISMGDIGKVSRLIGHHFGSEMTFASLSGASAPGQIPVEELAHLITAID
ncbi:type I 3-dehydroquinate dehydratase [Vagococcus elongatus]|uniref:3-dehydroquinate dehydratase n=1 Tax=Vagococcus elongatus TaxID=180344 RepID=A0A430APE8_9ENTE|nr:type I 3-dehydroquinate dehydratase [Vagococcus elongatus]RSU09853.1 type I 3-dehydroquinate dehydratase [Vagococcus elongatus]